MVLEFGLVIVGSSFEYDVLYVYRRIRGKLCHIRGIAISLTKTLHHFPLIRLVVPLAALAVRLVPFVLVSLAVPVVAVTVTIVLAVTATFSISVF